MISEQQKMTDAINTARGSLEILFHYFNGQNPYGLELNNETLRKLHPQQKLSTEPVEKPVCNVSESAANSGLKSD